MSRARQISNRLGKSGIAFLIALALYIVFYFTGQELLLVLDLFAILPIGFILAFRFFRSARQNALWSLRNRLLFVYGLFGVLPVLLLFVLFGLAGWTMMSELAVYLATSALERRVDAIESSVTTIRNIPPKVRAYAIPEIEKAYRDVFPGMIVCIKDTTGDHTYPPGSPAPEISPRWKNVHGLLVLRNQFYAWAHDVEPTEEITVLAPLSEQLIGDLVPHLGVIALREPRQLRDVFPRGSRMPPPVNRLDLPVFLAADISHSHLDTPGRSHRGILEVYSRPSAVMRALFSESDNFRGSIAEALITIAVLFLLVELGAVILGVSLSRRITSAVRQLYEGTRRVTRGDFSHRIPVTNTDQLGELADSFNQMTGNLERLLVIEKERERLQAEIEIASEVQQQLYPHEAPPTCGLKLTARCDPARMVSGDYYDYQALSGNKLAFAIGDVAGKGISAALLMATIQAALRAQFGQSLPMTENDCSNLPEINSAILVSKLNKQIYAHTAPEKYATFFFSLYDEPTKTLTYTNAGHLSPLLFRRQTVVPLDSNGTVVGAFPFSKYDESCLTIESGDLLVCYTDGITEPENAYGEEFGEGRLIDLVQKHLHMEDHEIIRIVFEAVRSWTGTPELHDDMTLLFARQVATA
ncbi:MAG: SpoIIE family protein phosphatase [Acidobacteriota bacterium]|nr:SpoIIE family protein phosphatase [Acidobacteriota bacterium]